MDFRGFSLFLFDYDSPWLPPIIEAEKHNRIRAHPKFIRDIRVQFIAFGRIIANVHR
jgi:hypothetical protein